MSNSPERVQSAARETGLAIRKEAIDFFTSESFSNCLSAVVTRAAGAKTLDASHVFDFSRIEADMRAATTWEEEFWRIDESKDVSLVSETRFRSLPDEQQFSNSNCLRRPAKNAFALRGLLSALRSAEVSEVASRAVNAEGVRMLTCDIARYAPGHYLRRHDDVFDGRIFGLVFFLHESWLPEYGTELVTEQPAGLARVVRPVPGSIAVMRLSGGHYHQVCTNVSNAWTRYSLAVHFGVRHD
jgi:Rps23 Pro-64 3,4-dihydroxylase Tpa1-like proline 4-hydroxylase